MLFELLYFKRLPFAIFDIFVSKSSSIVSVISWLTNAEPDQTSTLPAWIFVIVVSDKLSSDKLPISHFELDVLYFISPPFGRLVKLTSPKSSRFNNWFWNFDVLLLYTSVCLIAGFEIPTSDNSSKVSVLFAFSHFEVELLYFKTSPFWRLVIFTSKISFNFTASFIQFELALSYFKTSLSAVLLNVILFKFSKLLFSFNHFELALSYFKIWLSERFVIFVSDKVCIVPPAVVVFSHLLLDPLYTHDCPSCTLLIVEFKTENCGIWSTSSEFFHFDVVLS